ncbi:MAG: M28 family peptidase [Planctomycetota bacterium]
MPRRLAPPSVLALVALLPALRPGIATAQEPPARALARELCASPRLAGTSGSRRAARVVAGHLAEAGWEVSLDEREVLLSLPRRIEVVAWNAQGESLVARTAVFDPDALPPGDVPLFLAWSGSGEASGEVVDVGAGLAADYERLAGAGIPVAGRIALARYGGAYRGVKAALAEEKGCAGLLLFADPAEDGPARGEVWPRGPWRPGEEGERGSILPLGVAPGDPSTPGWPSPAPGAAGERRGEAERDARLPHLPCVPLGANDAGRILAAAGPVRARLAVEAPRELRAIQSVVARLAGSEPGLVLAGNHRDAWVRGAHDAGSGTVALLRAAQHLGERARGGWRPRHGILLGFWDAEEMGLIGSTEWAEANAAELGEEALVYVNADTAVSGLSFHASGTPGLETALGLVLDRVPSPRPEAAAGTSLGDEWRASFGEAAPALGLPGSGSDFAVFLHHLGIPVLDVGFGGNDGGQYHTAFDDFPLMDRFLDPTWRGHETAGAFLAELLAALAEEGRGAFDDAAAARAMAALARDAAAEGPWLGAERALRLELAFARLAEIAELVRARAPAGASPPPPFLRALRAPAGLPARPWFTNRLWAPSDETGYGVETLPSLRAAARAGPADLDRELADLVGAVDALTARWHDLLMPGMEAPGEAAAGGG